MEYPLWLIFIQLSYLCFLATLGLVLKAAQLYQEGKLRIPFLKN